MATLSSTQICGTYTSKYTVTEGTACTFVKSDNSTACEIFGCCSAITRGVQGAIYNPLRQYCYTGSFESPTGLLFNIDGWSDLSNVTTRNYGSFTEVLGGSVGNNVVGTEMIMWDENNDNYHKMCFTAWTQGGGGGFTYVRTPLTLSDDRLTVSSLTVGNEVVFPTDISIKAQNFYSQCGGSTICNKGEILLSSCNKSIGIGYDIGTCAFSNTIPLTRPINQSVFIGSSILNRNASSVLNSRTFANVFIGTAIACSVPQSTATNMCYNVGVGYASLSWLGCCYQGRFNSAIGASSSQLLKCGDYNTSLGWYSLRMNQTGSCNTGLGALALCNNSSYNNTTGVGYCALVTGSNQVQIGNSSTTTYVYGTVQNRSDERDKTEIRDTLLGLNFINCLRPVDFKWDMRDDYFSEAPTMPEISDDMSDEEIQSINEQHEADLEQWKNENNLGVVSSDGTHKRNRFHHGLIAQEVKQVIDNLGVDFGGYQDHSISDGDSTLTIGYDELIAPLIKSVQELKSTIDNLENRIQTLESN